MLKEFLPPVMLNYLTGFFYGWKGNYSSWQEAKNKCSGYDSTEILSKVKESLLKVKKGEVVFERDSVLFDKIQYSFPLLSALLYITAAKNGKLNILDFGGSLGSSYYQNINALKELHELNWCVVEQKHFVKEGLNAFESEQLHFFYDISSCIEKYKADVFMLASVLQYMEKPYALLDQIIKINIEYIIIDRTPFLESGNDRITIQKVPKKIYDASYPCWFLNEKNVLSSLSPYYDLVFEGTSPERLNIRHAALKCFFLKRKK